MKTIISLFSSAGVGDFGFKKNGFEFVATNELIEERLNIQKLNNKCRYKNGYILGDIKLESIKNKIFEEISFWENKHNIKYIDVVIATPPCQGISTANYKKKNETDRNSLVIEALELIDRINPKYFILENVRSFLKTMCFDPKDKKDKIINEAIDDYLEKKYNIYSKTINFKEYGVPSSRPRTLVIGTRKDFPQISPLSIFPTIKKEITLKKSIGHFKKLNEFNEYDNENILHFFRPYPIYMREWISELKEGQNSFSHSKVKPYKIIKNKRVILKGAFLGNKFSRMSWDKPAPAIHTRSDQIASNRTIHPSDDRVLSIAELMELMTIPNDFKWFDFKELEKTDKKYKFIQKQELKIRRSIGESVPTLIFSEIAKNIKSSEKQPYSLFYDLQFKNNRQTQNAAFYTPQSIIFNILKKIEIQKKRITILEPSSGWGTFLPQLIKKFQDKKKVEITLMDIDKEAIEEGKKIFKNLKIPSNFSIKWINKDFLKEENLPKFDLIVGNPPYKKVGNKNLYSLFLEKAISLSNNVSFILPKSFLNSDSNLHLRRQIKKKFHVFCIKEFGVRTFPSVNIETIILTLSFSYKKLKKLTEVGSYFGRTKIKEQNYVLLDRIWIPYRDENFDKFFNKLELDVFEPFRDRQITNKYIFDKGKIQVLKSKNIGKNEIIKKAGYDKFLNSIQQFNAKKYINSNCIIIPNFTYNLRASQLPKNTIFNGSVVLMKNKKQINTKKAIKLLNSEEYKYYYSVLHSFSKFTINLNKTIGFYMGVINNEKN